MNKCYYLAVGSLLVLSTSCENTITSEYDTVKAKKLILIDEDGKEHEVTVNQEGELVVK